VLPQRVDEARRGAASAVRPVFAWVIAPAVSALPDRGPLG